MTLLSVITEVVMAAAMLAYAGMFKLFWRITVVAIAVVCHIARRR